ncbi:hypothetical protein SLEP1_g46827 [Rubroshorea leprosula]|uniref:Uncharacterized protein n=1 Tax=Rubroshorea leprosula TaxID=152421 RepID=A0AAV5LQL0_9ROSI|nr:hypothetical protein SLEP1_g46827 [Rubroshorea leprosula]
MTLLGSVDFWTPSGDPVATSPLRRSPKVVVGFPNLVAMKPLTGDGHRLMGSPCPGVLDSRIAVVAPAYEHGDAASHDVESSSLFFNQSRAFSGERIPPLRRILHERRI